MKNVIELRGRQEFMGKEIPVVLGGFGKDAKCICDKTIAEIHGMKVIHVRELIRNNIKRFKKGVDFIDLKNVIGEHDDNLNCCASDAQQLLEGLGYTQMQISKAEHIYLLSERGYGKLIKIMDTDLAWEIHDQIMDEYFQLREEKRQDTIDMDDLDPDMRLANILVKNMTKQALEQKRQAEELKKLDNKIDSIKEVVSLDPNSWREETTRLINKIAMAFGGYENIKDVRNQSYDLLESRMGVNLSIRLTNKKKNMALNGVCKSKIDKLNKVDVIAEDKKLIQGYLAVIKDMAIKYGVYDE